MHPFFDSANGAEHEPEQSGDRAGVENRGEHVDPEDATGLADDAGSDRHQGKCAAAHPKKKREGLADR